MSLFARQKAAERLEDRLRKLEDLGAELERTGRKLELEFVELYDKVRHQMSRMAKREALSRKENGEDLPVLPDDDPLAHLDPVSRAIVERRSRQGKPK